MVAYIKIHESRKKPGRFRTLISRRSCDEVLLTLIHTVALAR